MGRDWNKKSIIQLNNADEPVVEAWLEEFIHVIYTWLYYQVGADASIAADLTARTFKRAVQQLETYSPDAESMMQWLREQARAARDEGLAERQITAQRPWAWSHLPDEILAGLAHFRDEPLSEDVVNNPYVREMVQASLAEMDGLNRELMMHRYNHLETAEFIADELGISTQDINDRLYRCRHSFRRMLMQLIQTVNPGFSESSASGSLELLDANLEKLLSSTNMVQPVSPKDQARIREIVLEAARQTAPLPTPESGKKWVFLGVGSAVAMVVLVVLLMVFFSEGNAPEPVVPVTTPQPEPTAPTVIVNQSDAIEDKLDEDEVRRVFQLGQEGDLAGLLAILRTGQYPSLLVALHYISQIGDESAIGVLEEAEMKWHPNGPADNPFAEAIVQIENRLLAESGAVIEEPQAVETPQAAEPEPAQPVQEPAVVETAVGGIVTDLAGQPLAGARVTLSENLLYAGAGTPRTLGQVEANAAGQYQFPHSAAEAFFIDCRSPRGDLAVSRAAWCGAEQNCRIDFGGKYGVYGVLSDANGAAGSVLYLSDALDPADAAFRAESVTDGEGQFSFFGAATGNYYLLSRTAANRIIRLASVEIEDADIVNWIVPVQQASLTAVIEVTETTPLISAVTLTYGADVSDDLEQFELDLQDDGTYVSEAIPFGSYMLVTDFETGMRLQQPVELNADRTLNITVPQGASALSGTFTGAGPQRFFLYNTDQRVRFDLVTDGAGMYAFDGMPAERYTLAAVVNHLVLDFMEIDLQSEPEQVLDIDAGELLAGLCPVYVVVTDSWGAMVSDAQVWVTGGGAVVTTQSSGRGAFLAIPAGEYSLYAALPGFSTAEKPIVVQAMPLQSPPNPANTIHLQLKSP
jgi:DNA-directed RNA polymerase specialized sigma24 family protein